MNAVVESSTGTHSPSRLPRTVLALGAVSFLTDASSEMIFPLLPLLLASLPGSPAAALGLIEGVAEATAAAVKVVSGRLSDRVPRRKPLVVAGYAVSSTVRPLVALATFWPHVLLVRFLDRIGKGVRSAPRDALIAEVTPPDRRGAAYGLHRAMDTAGAVAGPLLAAALLGLLALPLQPLAIGSAQGHLPERTIFLHQRQLSGQIVPIGVSGHSAVMGRRQELCQVPGVVVALEIDGVDAIPGQRPVLCVLADFLRVVERREGDVRHHAALLGAVAGDAVELGLGQLELAFPQRRDDLDGALAETL